MTSSSAAVDAAVVITALGYGGNLTDALAFCKSSHFTPYCCDVVASSNSGLRANFQAALTGVASTASPSDSSNNTPSSAGTALSSTAIGGIVVGAVAVLAIAGAVIVVRNRRNKSISASYIPVNISKNANFPPMAESYSLKAESAVQPQLFSIPPAVSPLLAAKEKNIVHRPYQAMQPDELTLEIGDFVEILERFDDGWCKGRKVTSGEEGMCPLPCFDRVDN
ncbi:hypothetical protein HK100_002173 [Physocladia obscura]|uniref:SH3 domain-containing protein n=1 Tax=Physocladia obscura TaxID=109957 RepID=A0AAD5T1R1_9FUNG|nr:hypothetical protein HK100_002173 [Physocladia obscura]